MLFIQFIQILEGFIDEDLADFIVDLMDNIIEAGFVAGAVIFTVAMLVIRAIEKGKNGK